MLDLNCCTILKHAVLSFVNTKDLLTECEVCIGKYLSEVFVQTERRRSEVCAKKLRQIPSRTDRANEVNKEFIIWLLVHFLLKFATLFLSSEFAVTLSPLAFLCRFLFTPDSTFIYRVFK